MLSIRAFIQARMTSERLPGKVLAPFKGRPLLDWVIEGVAQVIPRKAITVLTSENASDDPVASYLQDKDITVFRGPEKDVFARFQKALKSQPCEWVLRISADSPLLDAAVLQEVIDARQAELDLVTTIYPRTFPKGKNAELIRADTLLKIDAKKLSANESEHVTPIFYLHPEQFQIFNIESGNPHWAQHSFAIDTLEDLKRLAKLSEEEMDSFQFRSKTLNPA